jgi:hypothetical protein
MARQNSASLLSRAVMLVLMILGALVILNLLVAIAKVVFGLLFVAAVVGGLVYLFNRLRS